VPTRQVLHETTRPSGPSSFCFAPRRSGIRPQPPSSEDEIRRAVFGQVDLQTAELEIVSSIYDGFAAAITVKGQPRTIALTREYGDAVQLMAMIERSRSAQPAASEAGDKWEVIGPAAASDSETNEMAALRALPQAREDAQPVAALRPVVLAFAHLMEAKLKENDWKRGWKKDSALALLGRLREETAELDEKVQARSRFQLAINPPPALRLNELIANEAADVANFAMMVADVCGGLPDSAVRSIPESTTHPAPDALRVAVEALAVAKSQAERGADKAGCDGWRSQEMCRQVVPLIDQALAALQAEQKGGA
jgi:NTP pyrophosphatase (non-canonical NTP hydrolase)